MIHCNRLVSGVQYLGISALASFAKKEGHGFSFFDCSHYSWTTTKETYENFRYINNRIDLEYKHVGGDVSIAIKRDAKNILLDLQQKVENEQVDLIGISTFSDDWPFALFLIRHIHSKFSNIPIIIGGVHASIVPEEVIKNPEVTMVCLGEGEMPLVELLNSIDNGKLDLSIKNLWIKHNGEIIKNPLRPLMEFQESFPYLDWSMYNDTNFYYPCEGKLYRRGSVFLKRGCPYICTFCINDTYYKMYDNDKPSLHYFKTVEYAIREISYLKKKYNLEFLRFWDETFLALPYKYLVHFSDLYVKEINLPFTIETTANTVMRKKLSLLADIGCKSMSIGVETSNERQRKKVLGKNISNLAYEKCFEMMDEFGLKKVANFMFFLPHQTLDDMLQDIQLCREWGIDHPAARAFYPYKGTSLRDYCIENDMVCLDRLKEIEDEHSVQSIECLSNKFSTSQDSVLKFPDKIKYEGIMLLSNFLLFQETPDWMHNMLRKHILMNDKLSNKIIYEIEYYLYMKRFGDKPLKV
jgi:radical SAM superfamily enzyme YgiQ (UPF0313 family)